jgi:cysteinyl-tRNA synthetase
MPLQVYNSLSREKEDFIPVNPPYVGMYVCGPTVYGHSHLGHARSYITFDVIYRYLLFSGYKVRYVQNITDVGHLVGDRDQGEDKILKQAKLEKLEPVEIAYKYETSYFEDMDKLNILRPNISCRASGHIMEMIELIEKLLKSQFAYVTKEQNIYFNIRKFNGFGKLSGRKVEEAEESGRIEQAKDKINQEDFALWKKADASHLMQWDSPWGRGYPGWHLECSAMSNKYIGDTLDIHGGGLENIFPHHECEIAQSEAATGKPFTKYFIHHNMLTVNGTKMGKSLGNFIILKDLFKKFDPMVLRFYILQGHYRSPLDFTDDALNAAKTGYERLKNSLFALRFFIKDNKEVKDSFKDIDELKNKFLESINDDFNTPQAVALLYEILKISNIELTNKNPDLNKLVYINNTLTALLEDILGLKISQSSNNDSVEDKLIEYIIELRNVFRLQKDFKKSDEIRDKLLSIGITLKDGSDGSSYTR